MDGSCGGPSRDNDHAAHYRLVFISSRYLWHNEDERIRNETNRETTGRTREMRHKDNRAMAPCLPLQHIKVVHQRAVKWPSSPWLSALTEAFDMTVTEKQTCRGALITWENRVMES